MEERPRYFALLILTMFVATTIYIAWATDRGHGDISFETYTISPFEGDIIRYVLGPERDVDVVFDVYKTRQPTYQSPLPIVLTIHGVGGSKEMMYAFNIELARRNFTVISIDLPGHGEDTDSANGIVDMASTCRAALVYYWNRNPDVDNSTYGIVAHSMGVEVAFALSDWEVSPSTIVAIGSVGNLGFSEPAEFSGNLLYVVGALDELVPTSSAIAALRERTGIADAQPDIIYGSLDDGNATQLIMPFTDHVFEVIDNRTVSETLWWMVGSLQGEAQLDRTLPYNQHVFKQKTYAMASGAIALLLTLAPLMLILNDIVPKPSHKLKADIGFSTKSRKTLFVHSLLLSCVIGIAFTAAIAFSPTAFGVLLFTLLGPLTIFLLLGALTGKQTIRDLLGFSGIDYKTGRVETRWLLRGVLISAVCIIWLWAWTYLGFVTGGFEPRFIYPLMRIVGGARLVYLVMLAIMLVPFFMFETAWVRSVVVKPEQKHGWIGLFRKTIWALLCRVPGLLAVFGAGILVLGLLGVLSGFSLMIGLMMILFIVVASLSTVITVWADHLKMGPWLPTIMSAILFAWLLMSVMPLL